MKARSPQSRAAGKLQAAYRGRLERRDLQERVADAEKATSLSRMLNEPGRYYTLAAAEWAVIMDKVTLELRERREADEAAAMRELESRRERLRARAEEEMREEAEAADAELENLLAENAARLEAERTRVEALMVAQAEEEDAAIEAARAAAEAARRAAAEKAAAERVAKDEPKQLMTLEATKHAGRDAGVQMHIDPVDGSLRVSSVDADASPFARLLEYGDASPLHLTSSSVPLGSIISPLLSANRVPHSRSTAAPGPLPLVPPACLPIDSLFAPSGACAGTTTCTHSLTFHALPCPPRRYDDMLAILNDVELRHPDQAATALREADDVVLKVRSAAIRHDLP